MEEPIIGDLGQTAPCFLIVRTLWLLRKIAAGHHNGPFDVPQQQMMQGRIGKHEPESRKARSHRVSYAIAARHGQDHNRRRRTLEQHLFLTVDGAIPPNDV